MEMIWDEFIKREDLESSPGVIDQDCVRALTLNTYMVHMKDMIEMGMNLFPEAVSDHLEMVMMDIIMSQTYVLEGRRPDDEEISAWLKDPENVEARENLTELCIRATAETWPEVEQQLKELAPVADLAKMNWDSEERRKSVEELNARLERDGFIEL